jgi:hypothetical protein
LRKVANKSSDSALDNPDIDRVSEKRAALVTACIVDLGFLSQNLDGEGKH